MKVLLIANCSGLGGGISVQVILLHKKLDEAYISTEVFNTKKAWWQRLFILPLQLLKVGKEKDVFHIHGCSYAGFYPIIVGVCIGRLLRKKIIITYHGGDAQKFFTSFPKLVSHFFLKADKIIVQSYYLAAIFKKFGFDTYIIPNLIEFDATEIYRSKEIKPGIITTRSLKEIYDIKTAIEAFSIVQASYPEAYLYIIGTGPEEDKLKKMVAERGLHNVFFTGHINNVEIYSYLKKAQFWCNPTTKDNMPVSLLEAVNAGLIVVSTNVGGIPFMVEHLKSAWLVPTRSPIEMANAIISLLNDQTLSQSMIDNARATLPQYSWTSIKEKLLPLYTN